MIWQDDLDRIIEDEPHRLRDLPDLRGKTAAEIMRYFNKFGRFDTPPTAVNGTNGHTTTTNGHVPSLKGGGNNGGSGSANWITLEEFEECALQWSYHRASLQAGVTALRSKLGSVMQGDWDAIAIELASGYLDDLVPELYGMEAKAIVAQLQLTGKRNITSDTLFEQLMRIAVTKRMVFSFSGYENVVQRQALCLFNQYDLNQRSTVPKHVVYTWIINRQLNLSWAQEHASRLHGSITTPLQRETLINKWLGTIHGPDGDDVWTRTELMTLVY
jgi:hypothetical protein